MSDRAGGRVPMPAWLSLPLSPSLSASERLPCTATVLTDLDAVHHLSLPFFSDSYCLPN